MNIFLDLKKTTIRIPYLLGHIMGLTVNKPVVDMFGRLFNPFVVNRHVVGARYYNQVLNSVVVLKPIKMMDNLVFGQNTPQFLLHNQPMLKNVSLNSRIGVLWSEYINVLSSFNLAPSPLRVRGASPYVALVRTVLASTIFKFRRRYKELLVTGNTGSLNWGIGIFTLLNHQLNYRLSSI